MGPPDCTVGFLSPKTFEVEFQRSSDDDIIGLSPATSLRLQGHALDPAEENIMFGAAQKLTQQVFAHVCKVAKESHDPLYLPIHSQDRSLPIYTAYQQLLYLRRKH